MKMKKGLAKQLSILLLILGLLSFPSYAEEPTTQQEISTLQDEDIENMNLGELVEEIKNLDKEDIKKIKEEVDKIELNKEKIETEKTPLKTRIISMGIAMLTWFRDQLYSLRYPLIILMILYVILKYIQHKRKGGGNQWEEPDKEKRDNYT